MTRLLVSMLLLLTPAMGMERLSGWCEQGAKVVVAPTTPGGTPISRYFQQSYPVCTVTVYLTGTTTKASIFSTNNPSATPLANPFLANNFGYWDFYAANGHYDVQISGAGLTAPYTFGDMSLFDINEYNPCPGCILSATGFLSTGGQYNDFSSETGGIAVRAYNVRQTADGRSGGYIKLSPLTYNPGDGPPVFDQYGNPVRDPVYLPGDSLGSHDAVLFVAEATDLIPNPDLIFGIFTNQYMFSRVGFATDYASEASFQSLNGGMQALSFAAVNYVNSGQHAGTPPPLTNLDQFHPGAIFYDTLAGCEKVYNGTTWNCLGSGGGGGGTPGGADTNVQFNNAGAFGGNGNFTWNNATQLLSVVALDAAHAGIAVTNGFIQAQTGFVSLGTTYNAINNVLGGVAARSFTGTSYVQVGSNANVPGNPGNPLSTGDSLHAGTLFWDLSNGCLSVYNGSGWSCVGGGGGTSPGGPNTSVQYNGLGTFTGNSRFTWDPGQFLNVVAASSSSAGINVQTGFIQSATGFVAVPASAITYNAVSALGGGMAANSFTASKYLQAGTSNGIPSVTGGDSFHAGAMYWDTSLNQLRLYNGTAWGPIGGGSGTPGGSNTQVQYNSSGSFAGSSDFTWTQSSKLLNVVALNSSSAGINVQTGFIQSDVGFVTIGTTFNAVNAASGGMTAKSFTAQNYTQAGFGPSDPGTGLNPLTPGDSLNPGTIYWNTGSGAMRVYNGTSWQGFGATSPGGGNGAIQFNSSGSFGGNATGLNWDNGSSFLTITGNMSAGDGTFGTLTTSNITGTAVIQSGSTGTNISFQNSNFNFQVNGNGDVSAAGTILSTGSFNITGLATYRAGGSGVIDASRNGTFNQVTASGTAPGTGLFLSIATGTNLAFSTATSLATILGNGTINAAQYNSGGFTGVTSTTCSQFRAGICIAP